MRSNQPTPFGLWPTLYRLRAAWEDRRIGGGSMEEIRPSRFRAQGAEATHLATSIFSTVLSWQPGTCSPSRSVVSNMNNRSLMN